MSILDPERLVGEEARKALPSRLRDGFVDAYLSGDNILDIGYRGYRDDVVPIVPGTIGITLANLPSNYKADHKRFHTPASLMAEIEMPLKPNSYRLRRLVDNDAGFDYAIPPSRQSRGSYELEVVLERIEVPSRHVATSQPSHGLSVAPPSKTRGG